MSLQTETSLSRIFNSVTDPFVIYDRDYRILLVNPAFSATFQQPAESILGRKCYEALYNRRDLCPDCHVKEVFATGESQVREMLLTLPDGTQRYFEVHSYPVKDNEGRVIQAFEHSQDITARKKLEQQLKTSEEKYRTIVETVREGIFLLDYRARFTFVNDYFAKMLGYDPEEFQGRTLCSLMHEATRDQGRAQFKQNLKGLPVAQEFELLRQDGSVLHCLVSITPLMVGNDFHGSIGIVTDISPLKQVETQLRAAKDALAAQTLELKKTQQQLETLLDISRQINAKNSLAEIFTFIQNIALKIYPGAETKFSPPQCRRQRLPDPGGLPAPDQPAGAAAVAEAERDRRVSGAVGLFRPAQRQSVGHPPADQRDSVVFAAGGQGLCLLVRPAALDRGAVYRLFSPRHPDGPGFCHRGSPIF